MRTEVTTHDFELMDDAANQHHVYCPTCNNPLPFHYEFIATASKHEALTKLQEVVSDAWAHCPYCRKTSLAPVEWIGWPEGAEL